MSVSDGVGAVVPGGAAIYLVTVRNAGPSSVSSLSLTDAAPAAFRNLVFAPASGSYKASTHLWSGLSLGSGRSVTMLVAGTVDPAATGKFVDTVAVAPPTGTTDTNGANNSATDTDTLAPLADLSIALSDGVTSLVAGRSTAYTVTVRNNGVSTISSLLLTDASPSSLTGLVFAPASGSYSPGTHVWSGLTLATGQSVSMTVTGTVAPAAAGSLANTVTVAPPAGVTDPVSGNNSASDSDKLTAKADLSISNSDGATTAAPGSPTTYTVVVSNPGPSTATGATVSDSLPTSVGSDSWTGPNGTSGSGNLHATVTVPAGGTVSYTIVAAVSATATGTLVDAATVTAPAGLTDPNGANNSASDTDTLVPQTDLSVTNSDGATSVVPGTTTSYTIVVANHGPLAATGAVVADSPPPAVTAVSWTGPNGTSGSGPINATVTLSAGSSATYTLFATVDPGASGSLIDTATVTAPAGLIDSNPANNTAGDTDALNPTADLQISNSDGVTSVTAGRSTTYTVAVTNAGPSAVSGATVADPIPTGVDSFSWTGSDGSNGSGAIGTTITLAPTATITYTVTAAVDSSATGSISDTATASAPAGVSDSNPANNSATDSDTVTPAAITVNGRVKLGDLYLCNLGGLTDNTGLGNSVAVSDMDGVTVSQFLAVAEQKLGNGVVGSTDSFADLDTLATDIALAFENGVPFSFFADPHLSTKEECTPVDWRPNQIFASGQVGFEPGHPGLESTGELDYLFENVFTGPFGSVPFVVGDTTDTNGYTLSFDGPGDITNLLPTGGPAGPLTQSSSDPHATQVRTSGLFSGDVVTLALDVAFSDSYTQRTCSPPGSANSSGSPIAGIPCPWALGDMLSFGQVGWIDDPLGILDQVAGTNENNPYLILGDPAGNHIELTDATAVRNYLPTGGPPAALSTSFTNPASNNSGTGGVFGGDVVALQLDVDYADAGLLPNNSGLNFGDLTLCNVPGFPELTGKTVRQVLAIANTGLAGEPTGYSYTPAQLDQITSNLETAFADTLPQTTATYLYNGACPNSGTGLP